MAEKKWVPFNINYFVRVRLTDYGRQALRDWHRDLYERAGVTPSQYREPTEDADGWSEWQLWELIQKLGPSMTLGSPQQIALNEIQFDANWNSKDPAHE